ncbi:hypothetical protein NKR23_g8886 [Pleurostoma richardsiae]|uniref:Pkr1-like protein n=1 Tax=Pleurostoma richardsiae TaxID=41990 RepID=A0AA38RHK2_9PEZI|nr:hypothetical protein NKR23_g8886 [Pleurostoma richardsiae]
MSQFFQDLWESIFTPGPTPSLLLATNVTFACLQVVLAGLLFATYSVHFVVLSILCSGLWWAINWFARELQASHDRERREQARAARHTAAAAAAAATSSESETEVESVGGGKSAPAAGGSVVEIKEAAAGELKHRATLDASQGTKSSVSTEDEWEKVSESENEKNK